MRVAPLLPSPALRAVAIGPQVGTGKQASSIELESRFGAAVLAAPVMHCYSGPPMHLLSGVDSWDPVQRFLASAGRKGACRPLNARP